MLVQYIQWFESRLLTALRPLWCGLLLLPCLAWAAGDGIEIQHPELMPAGGVYVLDAQLNFDMPPGAEQAIRDGATMTLILDIRFEQARRFWFDRTLAELQQRYELSYHGVSQRFLVRNLNSGAQTSHADFVSAVDSFRTVSALPVMDVDLLQPDTPIEVLLHAATEVRTIPRALRMLLFWVDDYALESEWQRWSLRP